MNVKIDPSWKEHIGAEFGKPYFEQLTSFVRHEYATQTCYPPGSLIFNAYNLCPFDKVKVVIIGQDPYHEPGQAHGLSFSVADGVALPPSLQNIFKEIQADLGKPIPASGDLTRWAKQGVLLLNATLTVRAHQAASHQRHGWEAFTDATIHALSEGREHLMSFLFFLLLLTTILSVLLPIAAGMRCIARSGDCRTILRGWRRAERDEPTVG